MREHPVVLSGFFRQGQAVTGHLTMVAGGGGVIFVVPVCLEHALAVLDPGQDSVYVFKFHYFPSLTVSLLR